MKKIAFSGAAGNGISPLEQIMVLKGYSVYGSDHSFDIGKDTDRKEALESVGIKIVPQDGSAISPDTEYLCISAALKEENPDIKKARDLNIPIKYRSDLLQELLSQYRFGIAVGGTAGKTTTTAMIGYILHSLNKKPCMVNGGALCNFANRKGIPNYIYNEGEICVIEADESDGSIQKYHPYIGIINNIGNDHTSMDKLLGYFNTFASHSQNLIINLDCPKASGIKHPSTKTFSITNPDADFYAHSITPTPQGINYILNNKEYSLNILGRFNIYNALAAIAACSFFNISAEEAANTLSSFTGVKTRLEKISSNNDVIIFNDFAHNPSKIKAALSALKDYPGRIIAMYQPHTPFSAVNTGDETADNIAEVLSPEDIIIFQEIYELTPKDIGISSANIINRIKTNGHKNAFFLPQKQDTLKFILDNVKANDRIIIMGAHDNSLADFCKEISEKIAI